jgi:hypothetical protein
MFSQRGPSWDSNHVAKQGRHPQSAELAELDKPEQLVQAHMRGIAIATMGLANGPGELNLATKSPFKHVVRCRRVRERYG